MSDDYDDIYQSKMAAQWHRKALFDHPHCSDPDHPNCPDCVTIEESDEEGEEE